MFSRAVADIARHFEPAGWSYARSAARLTCRGRPFMLWLWFGTSYRNVRGERVVLTVSAGVRSRDSKAWRSKQPVAIGVDDMVAAGPVGNLAAVPTWLEWNLADERGRDAAISDVIAHIERLALPWFAAFADLRSAPAAG